MPVPGGLINKAALIAILVAGMNSATPVLPCCSAGAAGDAEVIDLIVYSDDAAARAAWVPLGRTAAVSIVDKDGQRALGMPCNFKDIGDDRAAWDLSVNIDMSLCQGVQFRFYCADSAPINNFNLYFKSGDGWYVGTFAAEHDGIWITITVDKASCKVEGAPAGWGKIEKLRMSAWRGQADNTELLLADMRILGKDASIVVVRGDSLIKDKPQESYSVDTYVESVVLGLNGNRLPYLLTSDLDSVGAALSGRELVILPYNPTLPDAAASAIAAFLKGGGKMIAFYILPPQLEEIAGIKPLAYIPQKAYGSFASIRFSDPLPAGMPREVQQHSWLIRDARPMPGRGRIAAEWLDKDGKATDNAALVRTDNSYLMTHIMIDGGSVDKRRMLLAMVGDLTPNIWESVAKRLIKKNNWFSPFSSFDEARRVLGGQGKGKPAALNALDKAIACEKGIQPLLADGKYPMAMQQAYDAQRLFQEAYCLVQAPAPGEERRGLWCHSAYGAGGMEWDAAMRVMRKNGFNSLFVNMLWGGSADYKSDVLPVSPEVGQKGDALEKCLAACKKYGVQCHVWKVNWYTGGRAPREFIERIAREGRTQVRFDGTPDDQWLCPSHPENRNLECAAMVEVAVKYAVDGIHFDYIRYPDRNSCFCAGCRQSFEESLGRKVINWPHDVRSDPDLSDKWLDFRRTQITALVAMVSEQVRKVSPKTQISAAVFSNWPMARDEVGQDWALWCKKGYVDFVCPMDYTEYDSGFTGLVRRQKEWASPRSFYPGIGFSVWKSPDSLVNLIGKIRITREFGTGGFTVFDYSSPSTRDAIERCGLGLTKPF